PELAVAEHRDDLTGRVVADALAVEPGGENIAGLVVLKFQAVQLDEVVEVQSPHPRLLPEAPALGDQPSFKPRPAQAIAHAGGIVTFQRPCYLVRPNHDLPLRHRHRLPFCVSSLHLHYNIMTP